MALGAALGFFAALVSFRLPRDEPVTLAGAPYAYRYVIMGLCGAALGLWAFFVHPGGLAVVGAVLGAWLLLLAVLDVEHFWLPDRLTLPLVVLGLIVAAVVGGLAAGLVGAAAGFLALAGLGWAYRRVRGRDGLGLGDAKLAAAAGAWTGWHGLPWVVLFAALAALAAGIAFRRADMRTPFGAYLAGALWLVWLYGPAG